LYTFGKESGYLQKSYLGIPHTDSVVFCSGHNFVLSNLQYYIIPLDTCRAITIRRSYMVWDISLTHTAVIALEWPVRVLAHVPVVMSHS